MNRKKICIVTSSEVTIRAFWITHLREVSSVFDVTVVTNTDNPEFLQEYGLQVPVYSIGIQRNISLLNDFKTLFKLYAHFKNNRFDVVHSVTPKAGLIAMLAALLSGVPYRVHTFTGQVWANKKNLTRCFLKFFDHMIVLFSSNLLVDSNSQRNYIIDEGIVRKKKIEVLANGSISGVDLQRFRPDLEKRNNIRERLGLKQSDIVFLFLGRLNYDKGIIDLAKAYRNICEHYPNVLLLVVGPDESDSLNTIRDICSVCQDRLLFVDFTTEPESYMAASDIFCLPSYREGFGTVIIEAAATGLPAIASRIYGISDAVDEGVTGLLHMPGDISELQDCMRIYINQPERRIKDGTAARRRVREKFSATEVTEELMAFYRKLLT